MYSVHFFEKRKLLISKLLNEVPSNGSELKLKGRKGKITDVIEVDENKYHVHIELEAVKKAAALAPVDKKKRK